MQLLLWENKSGGGIWPVCWIQPRTWTCPLHDYRKMSPCWLTVLLSPTPTR